MAISAALGACDFTPTLDIDLPEHEPRTAINAVLAVDSVAVVRLDVSTDPYILGRYNSRPDRPVEGAVVTLLRDGRPVERLAVRLRECEDYDNQTGQPTTYACGPYVGTVPMEAGATYTVRAEVPGLPTAEGTVTMPRRPTISVEEIGVTAEGRRQLRVRVQDPRGQGDRYGVSLLADRQYTYPNCDDRVTPPVCRDTTIVEPRQMTTFSSTDPVLLAAARDFDLEDNTFYFVSVADASFDGQTWTFTMTEAPYFYYYERRPEQETTLTVQIAALSGDVYDAYQILNFGGQDIENPFIEPVNLPSNVTGGYGLVGGVALAEVTMTATAERRASQAAGR